MFAKVFQDERLSRTFWMRGFNPPGSVVVLCSIATSRRQRRRGCEFGQSAFPGIAGQLAWIDQHSCQSLIVRKASLFRERCAIHPCHRVRAGRDGDLRFPRARDRHIDSRSSLPLSLLLTVAVMYTLNYSINNLTLMALTLAIGFLVDDAIVFLEKRSFRRAEHGESILKATFNSAGEISFTILFNDLVARRGLYPLVLLPGLLGRIFREFSVTIIVQFLLPVWFP